MIQDSMKKGSLKLNKVLNRLEGQSVMLKNLLRLTRELLISLAYQIQMNLKIYRFLQENILMMLLIIVCMGIELRVQCQQCLIMYQRSLSKIHNLSLLLRIKRTKQQVQVPTNIPQAQTIEKMIWKGRLLNQSEQEEEYTSKVCHSIPK